MVRIRDFRLAKGMTMKQLGEAIGVTESAIGFYETGKRKPDYDKLRQIALVLGCSIDDLVVDDAYSRFAESLTRLRKARGLSLPAFAEEFSTYNESTIPPSSVRAWEAGTRKLSEHGMKKVAAFFGVTLEDMIGEDSRRATEEALEFPKEVKEILGAARLMPPEKRQDMLRLLKIAFPEYFD